MTTQRPVRDFRLLNVFTGVFVAALVIATVASSKIAMFGSLAMPAGVLVFPLTFILNDILTEVYGYERSRSVVWTALACQALAGLAFLIADVLPSAPFWPHQEAFHSVLGFAPRIAAAGVASFFAGELSNSFVISKLKYRQQGRGGVAQAQRFLLSTLVGEAVDTAVVMTVAFGGVIPAGDLLRSAATLYVVKVLYETVALPLSVPTANWVKKFEGIDHIDIPETTDYNPFRFGVSERVVRDTARNLQN